ncbi:MAG: type restriction enzyme subunit [Clostridiales bacterium]|nr:type restriction enzyme subunit [Clostridiales bacterium]
MSWREITIGSFLKERPDRIKPDQANSLGLKRIEKIDFSGNIYLADNTSTRTDMILVKPGDLVISGINVAKGALAVYEGTEDVLATIHYSSYEFDKSIIDIEYLKWFLTSNIFMNILKEQVGGGIKTELKPKKFLPLKIKLPDINLQREIAKKINNVSNEIKALKETNEENYELISKLRQSILQEAVQGKLVPQDPNDEPASLLLERIKEEKERLIKEKKIEKEKPLPPITEDEIPYELPKGWEWVRFEKIARIASKPVNPEKYPNMFHIAPDNIEKGTGKLLLYRTVIEDGVKSVNHYFYPGQILYSKIRPNLSKAVVVEFEGLCSADMYPIVSYINTKYLLYFILSKTFLNQVVLRDNRVKMPKINQNDLNKVLVAVPPLNEQKRIVEKVDQLMALCDELEKNIEQSKKDSELLMQTVLQEAFKEA